MRFWLPKLRVAGSNPVFRSGSLRKIRQSSAKSLMYQ